MALKGAGELQQSLNQPNKYTEICSHDKIALELSTGFDGTTIFVDSLFNTEHSENIRERHPKRTQGEVSAKAYTPPETEGGVRPGNAGVQRSVGV